MKEVKKLSKDRYGLTMRGNSIPKEVTDKINELVEQVNSLQREIYDLRVVQNPYLQ